MTVIDSRPTEAAASVTTRLVPALVDGNEIAIPCPSWCSLDHTAEDPRNIVDVYHFGDFADLEMPRIGTSPVLLAFARLGLDPFSSNPRHREPYLYVEDGGGGADGYQRRGEAQQFARNLMAFAGKVLALSEQLPE
jgi:hypothetical protein